MATKAVPIEVARFKLGVTQQQYVELFWDNDFFAYFNETVVKEENVKLTSWERSSRSEDVEFSRTVTSVHPMPVKLPWLPQKTYISLVHTIRRDMSTNTLCIVEVSTVNGIPWIEPRIVTEWKVIQQPDISECLCVISLWFEYDYHSWLQPAVEMNSHRELLTYFEKWQEVANDVIECNAEPAEKKTVNRLVQLQDLFPIQEATYSNDISRTPSKSELTQIFREVPSPSTSIYDENHALPLPESLYSPEATSAYEISSLVIASTSSPISHLPTSPSSLCDNKLPKTNSPTAIPSTSGLFRRGFVYSSVHSFENILRVSAEIHWNDFDLSKLSLFFVMIISYPVISVRGLMGIIYCMLKIFLAIYCGVTFSDFVFVLFTKPRLLSSSLQQQALLDEEDIQSNSGTERPLRRRSRTFSARNLASIIAQDEEAAALPVTAPVIPAGMGSQTRISRGPTWRTVSEEEIQFSSLSRSTTMERSTSQLQSQRQVHHREDGSHAADFEATTQRGHLLNRTTNELQLPLSSTTKSSKELGVLKSISAAVDPVQSARKPHLHATPMETPSVFCGMNFIDPNLVPKFFT